MYKFACPATKTTPHPPHPFLCLLFLTKKNGKKIDNCTGSINVTTNICDRAGVSAGSGGCKAYATAMEELMNAAPVLMHNEYAVTTSPFCPDLSEEAGVRVCECVSVSLYM